MSGARTAIEALTAAGVTGHVLAPELGVHRTTVRRWAKGSTPNTRNLTRLRGLVTDLLAATLAGDTIADARQGAWLQRAKDALIPEQQRRDLALLADAIARTMAAAQRGRYTSVTADADPFGLCKADGDLDARLDAAFAV